MHIEIVTAQATAPGAAGAAGTANTGDSLVVKNGRGAIKVISSWSTRQLAGFTQFNTPSSHDTTRGYRVGCAAATGELTMAIGNDLTLEAQETISSLMAGSVTAGDIELDSLLVLYDNFPGIDMRSISPQSAYARAEKITTVESSIASVATGQYAEEAITADSDLLQANRDYAVLGLSARTVAHALTLKAPDFGNIRVGVPGMLRPELSQQWFVVMSRATGKNLVPVFNSGNKGQVNIGFVMNENAAATVVTAHLLMLK